jgi:hypothetical protein
VLVRTKASLYRACGDAERTKLGGPELVKKMTVVPQCRCSAAIKKNSEFV